MTSQKKAQNAIKNAEENRTQTSLQTNVANSKGHRGLDAFIVMCHELNAADGDLFVALAAASGSGRGMLWYVVVLVIMMLLLMKIRRIHDQSTSLSIFEQYQRYSLLTDISMPKT